MRAKAWTAAAGFIAATFVIWASPLIWATHAQPPAWPAAKQDRLMAWAPAAATALVQTVMSNFEPRRYPPEAYADWDSSTR